MWVHCICSPDISLFKERRNFIRLLVKSSSLLKVVCNALLASGCRMLVFRVLTVLILHVNAHCMYLNWTSHDRPNIVMLMSDAFVSHPFYTIINFLTVTVYSFFSHFAEWMLFQNLESCLNIKQKLLGSSDVFWYKTVIWLLFSYYWRMAG